MLIDANRLSNVIADNHNGYLQFIPDNHDLVGIIHVELLDVLSAAPKLHPKDLYIIAKLEEMFGDYDWSKSFERTQVIIHQEVLPSEILSILHKWLRTKCADIENIVVVTFLHTGLQSWWYEWCRVNQEKSFAIREMFFLDSPVKHSLSAWSACMENSTLFNKPKKFYLTHKKHKWLFSFWGGSYYTDERYYLLLTFSEFAAQAQIDFLGDLGDKDHILAYLENITYYKSQEEIDRIAAAHDLVQHRQLLVSESPGSQAKKDEPIDFQGLQWQIDRQCFASVIRESLNNNRYACVTEKTLRAFMHHCVALPIGYRAVQGLEQYGFWFPHDLIDYSYQHIDLFYDRVNGLKSQLHNLAKKSFAQLQNYYVDNIDYFLHNSKLVANLAMRTKNR